MSRYLTKRGILQIYDKDEVDYVTKYGDKSDIKFIVWTVETNQKYEPKIPEKPEETTEEEV